MRPDRIVIGADDERAIALLRAVYAPFQRNHERLLVMDVRSAELTKYAANAMLATRISFMNELANLADALGADIEHGAPGHRLRSAHRLSFPLSGRRLRRICFPKDVKALQHTARRARARRCASSPRSKPSTTRRSTRWSTRSSRASATILPARRSRCGDSRSSPNTDDMREAPSRVIIAALARARRDRRRLRSGRDGRGAGASSATRRACRSPSSPLAAVRRRRRAA